MGESDPKKLLKDVQTYLSDLQDKVEKQEKEIEVLEGLVKNLLKGNVKGIWLNRMKARFEVD